MMMCQFILPVIEIFGCMLGRIKNVLYKTMTKFNKATANLKTDISEEDMENIDDLKFAIKYKLSVFNSLASQTIYVDNTGGSENGKK